jgi:hypothetical protein
MSHKLIHRTGQSGKCRFDTSSFRSLAEAEQFASSIKTGDYLIEDTAGVIKYRISGQEIG